MHIPPGTLRAYLDNDTVLDAAARAHVEATVAADPAAAAALDAMRAEREATRCLFARFALPAPDGAATERAYRRVCARRDARSTRPNPVAAWWGSIVAAATAPRAARTRRTQGMAFGGAAAAFALVLLVVFVPVGSIASATLDQFRYQPEKFAVIAVRSGDMPLLMGEGGGRGSSAVGASRPAGIPGGATNTGGFGDLSQYVAVTSSLGQGKLPGRPVLSANMAQAFTGRAPSVPGYLPPGVAAQPLYLVSDAQKLNADLDLKNLRPALAANGGADMLPPGDDTASVFVNLPAAAITSYGYNAITVASGGILGAPGQRGVIVASMATPTVDVQGIDVRSLAATLAGMPGVPPALTAQLRGADLSRTLIVPVTDAQTVRNGTMIGGNPSTVIAQKDGSSAVALWFKGGILYIVAGNFDGETILKVAQSVK